MNKILVLIILLLSLFYIFSYKEYFQASSSSTATTETSSTTATTETSSTTATTETSSTTATTDTTLTIYKKLILTVKGNELTSTNKFKLISDLVKKSNIEKVEITKVSTEPTGTTASTTEPTGTTASSDVTTASSDVTTASSDVTTASTTTEPTGTTASTTTEPTGTTASTTTEPTGTTSSGEGFASSVTYIITISYTSNLTILVLYEIKKLLIVYNLLITKANDTNNKKITSIYFNELGNNAFSDNDESKNDSDDGDDGDDNRSLNINELLSKKSCIDTENNCSLAYEPYSEMEFYDMNPITNEKFTKNEIKDVKTRFDNKCKSKPNSKTQLCCDPYDTKLENIRQFISQEDIDNFNKVDVKKCNNSISKIRVCPKNMSDCGEGVWRKPSVYEICKLKNLDKDDYIVPASSQKPSTSASPSTTSVQPEKFYSESIKDIDIRKLTPDCNTNKCNSDEIHLRIDQNYNNDNVKTEHYYLIEAVKRDDESYLYDYYTKNYNVSVNDKLLYGYSGNTIFHNAIYHNAFKCIEYLLTTNFDYSNTNKDNNSVLHIACLKGNYDGVFKLLKHGVSIECKNNHGDTALHSAVRSGSYNCVKILLQNNASNCILVKNDYGEIPLHTSVLPVRYDLETDVEKRKSLKDRMNFEIVKILVEYGSDIHNKNKKGETILKTLTKKNKSIVREEIRTYLQRKYYHNYTSSEYMKMLNDYPEIRPFELDTTLDENLKKNYSEYDSKVNYKDLVKYYDDTVRDENLYVEKKN